MLKHQTMHQLLATAFPQHELVAGVAANRPVDGYLGWGHKPSTRLAVRWARRRNVTLWRCEDALIRSLRPGKASPPLGIMVDDLGTYYDASGPSRLEQEAQRDRSEQELNRAKRLIELWRQERVSKYNHRPETARPEGAFVLVVDQTAGDYSIQLGQADPSRFEEMLEDALKTHPDCTIVVKTHPEVANGTKKGHFDLKRLQRSSQIQVDPSGGHPTTLLEHAEAVYVVTSQLGFEGLLWNKPVHCYGMPFYAGWGLTNDKRSKPNRRRSISLERLVHAALIDCAVYLHPHSREPCTPEELINAIGEHRRQLREDPAHALGLGWVPWKRQRLSQFMPSTSVSHHRRWLSGNARQQPLLRWGRRLSVLKRYWRGPTLQVEDGFLRSIGLGVSNREPVSWVVDTRGMYFDATTESDLEQWLSHCKLTEKQRKRAEDLMKLIVHHNLSKYNLAGRRWKRPAGQQRVILVAGQVEEDASIRYGATGEIRTNVALLQAVRKQEPTAYIVYKPHPDVINGNRKPSKAEKGHAEHYCNAVVSDACISELLAEIDALHVITSLCGFEGLLRGVEVHSWGMPFYAGWGLTHDAVSCHRRQRRLDLSELVYGALIAYPRYRHPTSGWLISPEQAVRELIRQQTTKQASGNQACSAD